jgi:hypothetical protein
MSDNEKTKAASLVAKTLFAAGGTVLASLISPVLGLSVALAIMPEVAGYMTERIMNPRMATFFARFAAGDGDTHEAIAASLRDAMAADPALAQTIWSAVRAVLDVLDDSVVPALGALALEYREQKRPADSFFRGVTGLLSGLSADEFRALRNLVAACDRFEGDDDPRRVHANAEAGEILLAREHMSWDICGNNSPYDEVIMRQLKAHGLAMEAETDGYGGQIGPQFMFVRRETIGRLVRILAP